MPKMSIDSFTHHDRSTNVADTALAPRLANGALVAAAEVLGAARAVGNIDAGRVDQALIDLLQAAVDASQLDGSHLQNGECRQGGL